MKLVAISYSLALIFGMQLRARAAETQLPLLLNEDFERGMDRWQTTDPKGADPVWKIIEVGAPGNHALRCTGTSKYQPKYRSPFSIALLKDTSSPSG